MKTIYADYQATTPVDPRVVERMGPYWGDRFGNPHSADHVVGWQAAEAVREATDAVSSLIGADADEIIFTSGATEANNLAILGLARRALPMRRRLLVSAIEHKCVLATADFAASREGLTVETIPVDGEGFVDIDWLSSEVDETVLVVSIMAVNNEVGTIQDITSIASLLQQCGILFHCDAAQAPCAMDVSTLAQYADMISLSGHKFYGPQGIGALYIRRDVRGQVEPLIHGGGQQDGLRSGTVPVALTVGMGAAAEIVGSHEGAEDRLRIGSQRDRFVDALRCQNIPLKINGPDSERRHPGNANLRFSGRDAQNILGSLQPRLAASTGSACTSGVPEPSHVLRALGLSGEEADSSIRFSFGKFTTNEDVSRGAELVISALSD